MQGRGPWEGGTGMIPMTDEGDKAPPGGTGARTQTFAFWIPCSPEASLGFADATQRPPQGWFPVVFKSESQELQLPFPLVGVAVLMD